MSPELKYKRELWYSTILLLAPLIPFTHLFFSDGIDYFKILGHRIHHGYPSNQIYVWQVLIEISCLIIFYILFSKTKSLNRLFILPFNIYLLFCCISTIIGVTVLELLISQEGMILVTILLELSLFGMGKKRSSEEDPNKIEFKLIHIQNAGRQKRWNRKVAEFRNRRITNTDVKKRICESYYLLTLVEEESESSRVYKSQSKLKKNYRYWLLGVLIICTSIFPFSHYLVSSESTSLNLFGFTMSSYGFSNMEIFVWYTSKKLSVILILILFYLQGRNWWRHAVLPGMVLFAYQLWECFQGNQRIEEYSNSRILPTILVLLIVFIFISKVVRIQVSISHNIRYLREELEHGIRHIASR